MKSALPDFGIDPSMVLSRHQIVKDVLLLFERFVAKKNIKIQPKSIQSRVRRQSLQEVASEDVFFWTVRASLASMGRPGSDFRVSWGSLWDPQNGLKTVRAGRRPV